MYTARSHLETSCSERLARRIGQDCQHPHSVDAMSFSACCVVPLGLCRLGAPHSRQGAGGLPKQKVRAGGTWRDHAACLLLCSSFMGEKGSVLSI